MLQDELLRAILERPELDEPRLAYAAFLEARGDVRHAEFIRVQCEIATLGEGDPRLARLRARESKLAGNGFMRDETWFSYNNLKTRWAGPIRELVRGWRFRRGFVECIELKVNFFLERADELFRLAPIRQVEFRENELGPGAIAALASDPNLSRLTEIGFDHTPVRDPGLKLLLDSPHVGPLTLLRLLSCGITEIGARYLASSPKLSRLKVLDLSDILMHYSLSHDNRIGVEFARALASSPFLKCLTSLQLGGDPPTGLHHEIGDAGAASLAASVNLKHATSLDLSCNQIGDPGVLSLAASPFLGHLINLDLRGNRITAWGVQALIDSPHLSGLTSIGLSENPGGFGIRYYEDQGCCVDWREDVAGKARLEERFPRKLRLY